MISGFTATSVAILVATGGAAVASAVIFGIARRRKDAPASRAFARFALFVALWNALSVGTFLAPGRLPVVVFDSTEAIVSLLTAFLWIEFVLEYTGHGAWLTRKRRALLWAEPAAYVVTELGTLADPAARAVTTVRRYDGLAYVVHDVTSPLAVVWFGVPMAVTLVSFALLGRFVLRTRGGYRKQAATVFAAGFVVYAGIAGYFATSSGSTLAFDPTPALNAVMALMVGVALFEMDFLEITPLATDLLFEEIPDPVFVLSPTGTVIDANEAAASVAGDGVEGRDLSAVLPALEPALDDETQQVTVETADGAERVFDLNVSPLYGPTDRHRGRLVVMRDVTAQVARERELQRQNDRLDRFASVVSHDLRNPLNVARGYAQMAYESGDTSDLDRSLSAMDDMEGLIEDVLTLARQGRAVDETERVDLVAVAEDAWPFVTEEATLVVESTGEVEADRDRLAELLGNCFRNAVEHGATDITVWVGATDDGFYVEDDGPGIPADEREDVFESGYTTAESGTGLGLSIVADIARAHGWSVDAESGRTGGARVVVSGATVRNRTPLDDATA